MTARCAAVFFALLAGCGGGTSPGDGGRPDSAVGPDTGEGPALCSVDADCDDGRVCTGAERCLPDDARADAAGCVPGAPPPCDDGVECTVDRCDEGRAGCVHAAPDRDGDGHADAACVDASGIPLGDDCDDGDANRFPGNLEVCDGHDEDCDDTTLGIRDEDGDGAASAACCNPTADGAPRCGGDCRDDDPTIRPGVADGPRMNCDDLDNDCDGMPDTGCPCVDGRSRECGSAAALGRVGTCRPGQQFCVEGAWTEVCTGEVSPGVEICDGADNDCDELVDEGAKTTYYRDADGDGFGAAGESVEACSLPAGYSAQATDCDDGDADVRPTATELCDTIDNNCSMTIDEGCACASGASRPCGPSTEEGECVFGSQRCEAGAWGACVGAVLPFPETCNGRDDDCDGTVDDGVLIPVYRDADGDGFGDASDSVDACGPGGGFVSLGTDCDDGVPSSNPAAPELCNGRDDDCDGDVDEGVVRTVYTDVDGDGYGVDATARLGCVTEPGVAVRGGDCDDATAARSPARPEVCNAVDDDCDSLVDDITDGTVACFAGEVTSCTNDCGVPGTAICAASCLGFEACSSTLHETCNYCDDDGDGTFADEKDLAVYSPTERLGCTADLFGAARCETAAAGSTSGSYGTEVVLLDGTTNDQAGAVWLSPEELTVGWGPVEVDVVMQVRTVPNGATDTEQPLGGWAIVLAKGGTLGVGPGSENGVPATVLGPSLRWYWSNFRSCFQYTATGFPPEEPESVRLVQAARDRRSATDDMFYYCTRGEEVSGLAGFDTGSTTVQRQHMRLRWTPDDPTTSFADEERIEVFVESPDGTTTRALSYPIGAVPGQSAENEISTGQTLRVGITAATFTATGFQGPPAGWTFGVPVEAKMSLFVFNAPPPGCGDCQPYYSDQDATLSLGGICPP